jgi:signal transduction histidine kinase
MPRSLGARTTIAAALSILLALVVVGIGIDLFVGRHLHRSLDRSLRARAVEIAQLSASAPALLTSPGTLDAPLGGQQLSVEVVDRHGRIVARSLSLGGRVLQVGQPLRSVTAKGKGRFFDTRLGSEHLRVFVAPLADTGGTAAGGAVAVAASTHDLSETLASVHLFVLLAALIAAGVSALVLSLLMRRALSPLGRLAGAAADIERTGDPSRRLPDPPADDEVAQLAHTLNAMLTSLERARETERRFLADASHELRTPLTALVGNVSYLARHGATPELIDDLQADAARLATLADDLLVLSKEEQAPPVDELVRLDALAHAAGEEDSAIDVSAPGPVAVRGDRQALERALANLLENARRYGKGRMAVEVSSANGRAFLAVADEGSGVQPYEAERAFERFWRGRRDTPGSGLGLAIVRATAERHGGRAYATGARFTIELPLSENSQRPGL